MKAHGKGVGISINAGGMTAINNFKQRYTETPPVAAPAFKPLTNYVLPRAEERAIYAALPSWKAEP